MVDESETSGAPTEVPPPWPQMSCADTKHEWHQGKDHMTNERAQEGRAWYLWRAREGEGECRVLQVLLQPWEKMDFLSVGVNLRYILQKVESTQ